MPYYESVFIARQDVPASQVESLTDDFSKSIEDGGGKVAKKESWGLRTLAYKIKNNRKGHYTLLNIDAPAGAVQEMERLMHINEDVLRHLTVKVDELEEGPSVVMQGRSGRDERPRRHRDDDERHRDDDERHRDHGERPRRPRARKEEAGEDDKAAKDDKAGKDAKGAKDDKAAKDDKDSKAGKAGEDTDEGQPDDAADKTGDDA